MEDPVLQSRSFDPSDAQPSTIKTKNKVERISLLGGMIGLLFTNPKKALESCISNNNAQGWRAIQQHATHNQFVLILQILLLICTLGLITWSAGYLVPFAKDE